MEHKQELHKLMKKYLPINEGRITPLFLNNKIISVNTNILYLTKKNENKTQMIEFKNEIKQIEVEINDNIYLLTETNLYLINIDSLEKRVISKIEADYFITISNSLFLFFKKNNIILFNCLTNKTYKKKINYIYNINIKPIFNSNYIYLINEDNNLIKLNINTLIIKEDIIIKTNILIKEIKKEDKDIYLLNETGNIFILRNNSIELIKELKLINEIKQFQIFLNKIALIKNNEILIYNLNNGDYLFKIEFIINKDIKLGLPNFICEDSSIYLLEDYIIKYQIHSIKEISDIFINNNEITSNIIIAADHLYISSNENLLEDINNINNIFIGKKIYQPDSVLNIKIDSINKLIFICTSNILRIYKLNCITLIYESITHIQQINSIDIIKYKDIFYISTVSKDLSIQLNEYKYNNNKIKIINILTKVIHKKEINCIKLLIKDNKLLIITGSNDKTIKIHSINGKLIKTITNQIKGIWSIEKIKDYLISSSSDMSICIYDIKNDFLLINKIEEHKSSVVKISEYKEGFITCDLDGIIKYFIIKQNIIKIKWSYNLSNERIWSIFGIKIFNEYFINVGDANGVIYILKNKEKEIKEINKLKEIENKERDFILKTKSFNEKLKILFSLKNEDYFLIKYLFINYKENQIENQIEFINIFKSNINKTIHLINKMKNIKYIEIIIFLLIKLDDKKLNKLFIKQLNKFFEYLENLNIDLIECQLLSS